SHSNLIEKLLDPLDAPCEQFFSSSVEAAVFGAGDHCDLICAQFDRADQIEGTKAGNAWNQHAQDARLPDFLFGLLVQKLPAGCLIETTIGNHERSCDLRSIRLGQNRSQSILHTICGKS